MERKHLGSGVFRMSIFQRLDVFGGMVAVVMSVMTLRKPEDFAL